MEVLRHHRLTTKYLGQTPRRIHQTNETSKKFHKVTKLSHWTV